MKDKETKKVVAPLPMDLYKGFAKKCIDLNTHMNEVQIELIEKFVKGETTLD
jgi:hypothetical protein